MTKVISVGLCFFAVACVAPAAPVAGASGACSSAAQSAEEKNAGGAQEAGKQSAGELQRPADALFAGAAAALDAKQYQKAQALFNEFLKKFQTDGRAAEARVYAGICDYQQGQAPRAVEAWTRVVNMELMQKRRSAALLLGLEQLAGHWRSQNKRAELDKTLAQMRTLFPEESATRQQHQLAAAARFESGDYAGAAALYSHAGPLRGRDADNYTLAKELAGGGLSVRRLIDKATGYWETDSPAVAARLYEEALKRNPAAGEKFEAMTHLGWCLYLQKDYEKAEKLWKDVIASAPKGEQWRGESRWRLVVLSAGVRNDRNKARELCAEQFEEFKGVFLGRQSKLAQAWLYLVDKQWAEAKRHFEELAATYPEQDNERIAEYIARCEEGMQKK